MKNQYKAICRVKVDGKEGFDKILLNFSIEGKEDEENISELQAFVCQQVESYLYNTFKLSYYDYTYNFDIERM